MAYAWAPTSCGAAAQQHTSRCVALRPGVQCLRKQHAVQMLAGCQFNQLRTCQAVHATPPDVDSVHSWHDELKSLQESTKRPQLTGLDGSERWHDNERVFLVGVALKNHRSEFSIHESLEELERLADTAGLEVVGQTYQMLDEASPRTYIGSGKVAEVATQVELLEVDTVIFDDELSPGQLRNLERAMGNNTRVCDRTALILDIFSQRAATKEGQLQVELAQAEYQLPRLTRMWTHLERQAGGRVRGMGEKQIEVDKRFLRTKMARLRDQLESVQTHRSQYRKRRAQANIPVLALVGYTNAGKSTLLNRLTDAQVLAEDKLFATLDPTTRRVALSSGKEVLMTDTVGFIQKLPTQLVAAFRATLEEIQEASILLHVVDVSHANAAAQSEAVLQVLDDIGVDEDVPLITVWNKVDAAVDPDMVRSVAAARPRTVCISAKTGEGVDELLAAVERVLEDCMTTVQVMVPYKNGDVVAEIMKNGIVKEQQYTAEGTLITARVSAAVAGRIREHIVRA